jgi:DNA-binding CsgD family transcriptional regulator
MEPTAMEQPGAHGARTRRIVAGRDEEVSALRRFVDRIRSGPASLLVRGEMGIGKSTLLGLAVAAAESGGARVLLANPDAPEAVLPFSTLFDLVDPVLDAVSDLLPGPQSAALHVALQRSSPGEKPTELLAVAVGLLGLVRLLARDAPLLLAIDDAQWMDEASAATLRFVARRLRDEPVGFLASVRAGEDPGRDASWLRAPGREPAVLEVGPIGDDAILATLRAGTGIPLSARQARQVVAAAAGNPFFAIELQRAVALGSGRPGEPLPSLPDSLRDLLEARLGAFDPTVREALALVAALAQPRLTLVDRVVGVPVAGLLEPAIADGVLALEGERLRFTHPLIRAAAYRLGSAADRRERHHRLAAIVRDPVERARHLAAATEGINALAARAIAAGAELARRRGAPEDAGELFLAAAAHASRAYRLRVGWLRSAANCLVASGRPAEARELLEDAIEATPPGTDHASLLLALSAILYREEDGPAARHVLVRGLSQAAGDTTLATGFEQQLSLVDTMVGDLAAAEVHGRRALALAEAAGDPAAQAGPLAFMAMLEFLRGRGYPAGLMARSLELEGAVAPQMLVEWRPSMIHALVQAWTGRLHESRALLERLHAEAQATGDEAAIPYLLYVRCQVELASGRWDVAQAIAETGRTYAEETGGLMRSLLESAIARVDAFHGRLAQASGGASAALATALERGYGPAIQENAAVLGFVGLSCDRPEDTVQALAPIVPFMDAAGVLDPGVRNFVPDLVEALIRLGRVAEAEAVLGPYEALAEKLERVSAMPLAARCRALLAIAAGDTDAALAFAGRALDLHADLPMPFERARTLLVLGTAHRRRREKRDAAAALAEAGAIFQALGSPAWANRARSEQERVGLRPASPASLSETERRVAELAARGLTTREIAAAAFLSPKGAEKALARAYQKLDVHSRAELGAHMASGR